MKDPVKILVSNRKALHEYRVVETFEAGIVLRGTEVKSLRMGKGNIAESWVLITDQDEAFLQQVSITPYSHGNMFNHPDQGPRKLLLKKKEIFQIQKQTHRRGFTAIPLKIYIPPHSGLIKVTVAVVEGKKDHDKRADEQAKQAKKDIQRALKYKQQHS